MGRALAGGRHPGAQLEQAAVPAQFQQPCPAQACQHSSHMGKVELPHSPLIWCRSEWQMPQCLRVVPAHCGRLDGWAAKMRRAGTRAGQGRGPRPAQPAQPAASLALSAQCSAAPAGEAGPPPPGRQAHARDLEADIIRAHCATGGGPGPGCAVSQAVSGTKTPPSLRPCTPPSRAPMPRSARAWCSQRPRTRAALKAEGREHATGVARRKAQAVAGRALGGVAAPAVQRVLAGSKGGGVCGARARAAGVAFRGDGSGLGAAGLLGQGALHTRGSPRCAHRRWWPCRCRPPAPAAPASAEPNGVGGRAEC